MIYFIQELESGSIKIGKSVAPLKRLKSLQSGNIRELVLAGWIDGGLYEEKLWHKDFNDSRLSGEWFLPTPRLCDAIYGAVRDFISSGKFSGLDKQIPHEFGGAVLNQYFIDSKPIKKTEYQDDEE
jgi:hypothetical protein